MHQQPQLGRSTLFGSIFLIQIVHKVFSLAIKRFLHFAYQHFCKHRWLYTGLESSKEAVARAFSSPSSTARSGSEGESSARVSSAAAQGSDASTSTSSYDPSSPVSDVGVSGRNAEGSQHQQGSVPHSTMGMLQGDGGDSVLAAAADYVEHYAGNHSREEGSSSTGDLNGSSSSSSSVDNSSTDGGQKQEGAPRSNEQ